MVQFDQLQLVCIAGYSIKFGFKGDRDAVKFSHVVLTRTGTMVFLCGGGRKNNNKSCRFFMSL